MTEKQFLAMVRQLARLHGWLCIHHHDSRRSEPGFPDLVLVPRPRRGAPTGRTIFAELKTDTGKLTVEQELWIATLESDGQNVYVWRPRDWPEIERTLGANA